MILPSLIRNEIEDSMSHGGPLSAFCFIIDSWAAIDYFGGSARTGSSPLNFKLKTTSSFLSEVLTVEVMAPSFFLAPNEVSIWQGSLGIEASSDLNDGSTLPILGSAYGASFNYGISPTYLSLNTATSSLVS